jgi:transcriptional regulator with AAA-type ATPase domain/tetratricopeptide (TPR) repeat protein
LLGESPGIVEVRHQIRRLLPRLSGGGRQPAVLILGETGTGKTLIARLIHRAVARPGNCVDINCAAFPETLLEAELFGYEAGAFTDARRAKPGLVQEANGGTLFLDEVSLLPPALQAKLLKVLDERRVRRLGGTRSEPVNVLVISATNEDLEAAVASGRFREDLYHRLAVLPITLPPLRERGQDVLLLADHFLARVCADYGLAPKTFTADAREAILAHPWRGNVRELSNVIERAALSTELERLSAALLHLTVPPRSPAVASIEPAAGRGEAPGGDERLQLLQALGETGWNISQAAHRLGISRNTIRYRIDKYGLRRGMTVDALPAPAAPLPPASPAPAARTESDPPERPLVRWDHRRVTYLIARIRDLGGSLSVRSSRALEILIEKVRSFGGRVTDLGPAGLTAIFGLEPVEDAPLRAANGALAMRKAAERADWPSGVSLRIGIHVAEAMVGTFSGATEIDEAAKREAVTLVDGGLEVADADTIFVSDAAAPFLERRCDLVAEGSLFRLLSCRIDGRVFGKQMAAHVGRGRQLDLLRMAFESASRGDGQVVGLTGEAGIGKSRLLFEFRQSLAGEPVTYAEGTCLSYGQAISYLPVSEILRALLDSPDMEGETAAAAVEAALGRFGIAGDTVSLLLQLLGLAANGATLDLPSQAVKARIFDAVTRIILELSQERPLVLAVEDVHWIDPTSEEFFTSLVERVGGARILMIFTYRPGYRAPWIGREFATQIPLPALSPDESAALLESILPAVDVARTLIDLVIAKAEGNPFFLEELAHALDDAPRTAVLSKVPDTVEEMLRARIDRLPERERGILQAAALIGRHVPLSLLAGIVDLGAEELRQALGELVAAEFLRERAAGPDQEYRFKHALTQETAYQSLDRGDRLALHRRALEALEKQAGSRVTEQVEHLAHHALRGERWDRALTYCARAGAKAAGRSANREAVDYLEQALTALRHLPHDREAAEQAIDLRLRLRNPLWALGALGRVAEVLREAETLATALGDRRRAALVATYLTQYYWGVAEHDQALAAGARALELATGDVQLETEALFYLGIVHFSLGRYRAAAATLTRSASSPAAALGFSKRAQAIAGSVARAYLARCLAELGEFAEGIARAAEGLELAERIGHPFAVSGSRFGMGSVYLRKGDFAQAIAVLEPALDLVRGRNLDNWYPPVGATLGAAYALSGRADEGLALLEHAVARSARMDIRASASLWVTYLGEAQLLAGRLDDARRSAEHALETARAHNERGYQAWARRLSGEIALARAVPDVEVATARFGDALAIAEELGMRPLLALTHRGLGGALGRGGDAAAAARHREIAATLLRDLGMGTWPSSGPAPV